MSEAAISTAVPAASGQTVDNVNFWRRLVRKPMALLAIGWLVLIVIASVFAQQLAPFDPLRQSLLAIKQLPDSIHWLGTDALGRDVLSRLLHGGLPTIAGIVQAVTVAGVLGISMGLAAGYFGGWFDRFVSQLNDLVMALPTIVILLSVLAIFQRDMFAAMVTMGVMGSAGVSRVIRSATMGVREELYIEAARISGLSDLAIVVRHVIPRIVGPMIVQLSLFAAIAVLMQTGISFLGLGVQPPRPTWGGMIFDASVSLNDFPWLLVPSGLTVALTILAFGLLGDAARDAAAEGWSSTADTRGRRKPAKNLVLPSASNAPALPDAVVSVRNLSIAAGAKFLVKGVDFDLRHGETLGIVGESGSGKTLSSLSLIGLLPHGTRTVSGSMTIGGRTIALDDEKSLAALRGSTIGMIFQEPMAALDPCFTVGHHLTEVIRRFEKVGHRAARERAVDLLDQVRIPDPREVAGRYPHQISGGMAQRVGIARALAPSPKVLLADEPTTALDVTVQAEILDLIRGLSEARGMSVILVTHDWGVVADICDRAMVLYHGDVLETASVEDIFARPQHPYTKALLRANPHNAPVGAPLPTIQQALSGIEGSRS